MLERFVHEGHELALIIRRSYSEDGVNFFTDDDYSQQLAFMKRPKDEVIKPHYHNVVERSVRLTQEVLIIRSGRLRVDLYAQDRTYVGSTEIGEGDVLLLAGGGHGFKMLEPVEMIEVKQGPYLRAEDKVQFSGVAEADVRPCSEAVRRVEGSPR